MAREVRGRDKTVNGGGTRQNRNTDYNKQTRHIPVIKLDVMSYAARRYLLVLSGVCTRIVCEIIFGENTKINNV